MTDSDHDHNLDSREFLLSLVTAKDGEVFADSRQVAQRFGRQHGHVLRDIENIAPKLETSPKPLFRKVELPDSYGRPQPAYEMTEDGFVLLVMGMNGEEAMAWKLRYVRAFNLMRAELAKSQFQIPDNLGDALILAGKLEKERQEAVAMVAKQQPHVDAQRRLEAAEGAMSLRDAAKRLKLKVDDLSEYLVEWGLCYRNSRRRLRPYGQYTVKRDGMKAATTGYFDMRGVQVITEGGVIRDQVSMVITAKGLGVIARKLGSRLDDDQPNLL